MGLQNAQRPTVSTAGMRGSPYGDKLAFLAPQCDMKCKNMEHLYTYANKNSLFFFEGSIFKCKMGI